jgi:hypothetical protein
MAALGRHMAAMGDIRLHWRDKFAMRIHAVALEGRKAESHIDNSALLDIDLPTNIGCDWLDFSS